jgi:putative ABC transport system permease protein
MTLLIADGYRSTAIEESVRSLLKRIHDVHPDDPSGIDGFNSEKEFRKLVNLFEGISTLSWVVGVLTLLAGAIGVSNILMISITERTREIGIRKAMGATPWSVMLQIVQEAVVLTGLSGMLGLMSGVGVLALAQSIIESMPKSGGPSFFAAPDLDIKLALVSVGVLVLAGGIAGLLPARNAVSIRPVEALSHE